jgi:hypothetical protein
VYVILLLMVFDPLVQERGPPVQRPALDG